MRGEVGRDAEHRHADVLWCGLMGTQESMVGRTAFGAWVDVCPAERQQGAGHDLLSVTLTQEATAKRRHLARVTASSVMLTFLTACWFF